MKKLLVKLILSFVDAQSVAEMTASSIASLTNKLDKSKEISDIVKKIDEMDTKSKIFRKMLADGKIDEVEEGQLKEMLTPVAELAVAAIKKSIA